MRHAQPDYLGSYQRDTSKGTLLALVLAVAAPALVVALAVGWRPPAPPIAPVMMWLRGSDGVRAPAAPALPADWPLADGWFYAASPPQAGQTDADGYSVTDADGIPFWTEYQSLGGPQYLGSPRSRRYSGDDGMLQVFQRGVLCFESGASSVTVVPLLDRLHAEGHDAELALQWGVPELEVPVPDAAPPERMAERLHWLLGEFPAFKTYIDASPDTQELLGWPTSQVRDVGDYYTVRFQSGVLQQWKQDMPWAKAGDVTAANVGDIAIALGGFPPDALEPETAQTPAPVAATP